MSLNNVLLWLNSLDVHTENVNVSNSKECGYGLYARCPINENSLVLSIPERLFIKPTFENKELNGFEHLILHLLDDRPNPYVDFLRSLNPIPEWRHFHVEDYPQILRHQMDKHLKKYNRSRVKLPHYEDDAFQWAYYIINTRCVHLAMELTSNDPDDHLCLIPYLDFVNHSVEPNTISKFNNSTRSYEVRAIKSIDSNEQITFLYNPHSNIDLFIEYGFVLESNPHNRLNVECELEKILSSEQVETIKTFNYWNSLELYAGENDLSWTIIKAIELSHDETHWSPYDDPPVENKTRLYQRIQLFLDMAQQNIVEDFHRWISRGARLEKTILFNDCFSILRDSSLIVKKDLL